MELYKDSNAYVVNNFMKYLKYFLIVIAQFAIVELVIWIHTTGIGWHIEKLLPGDAISLWGTVATIVFLVFSVLALWNIDQKIQELNEIKESISSKSVEIETKNREVMLEADKVQKDLVNKAEEQIKRILDKSTYRQNFYDTLTRIANILDPGLRVQEYTHFLRTGGNIEGINYAYVYICRGDAYLELARNDKALSDYETAQRLDKATVAPILALGHYYVTIKDYAKSIEVYKRGLEMEPQNENLMMNIANSYSAMGNFQEADKYYDKALTFNPDLTLAYYNKSRMASESTDPIMKEKRMTYLNHCLEIMPYFHQARINKASILRDEGKNEEAAEELTKVIKTFLHEDYIMAILQRGIAYRLQGKMPFALIDFQMVLFLESHNVQNLSNLSMTYLSMGFINEAAFAAQEGLKEAKKQGKHDCDNEFGEVLLRIDAMNRIAVPIRVDEKNNKS